MVQVIFLYKLTSAIPYPPKKDLKTDSRCFQEEDGIKCQIFKLAVQDRRDTP